MITLASASSLLFPEIDNELVLSRVCDVLWVQHGGSGMNITWNEVWDLEWDELINLIDEVNRRRKAESDALKKAHKGSH